MIMLKQPFSEVEVNSGRIFTVIEVNILKAIINTKSWVFNLIGSLLTVVKPVSCSLSKYGTDNFITENVCFKNSRKLDSVENKIRDIFIQCLVFNKTVDSTHACWI